MSDNIKWARISDWDFDAFSLNTRLRSMAGQTNVAEALTRECRSRFGKDPDVTPRPSDEMYFLDSGLPRNRPS